MKASSGSKQSNAKAAGALSAQGKPPASRGNGPAQASSSKGGKGASSGKDSDAASSSSRAGAAKHSAKGGAGGNASALLANQLGAVQEGPSTTDWSAELDLPEPTDDAFEQALQRALDALHHPPGQALTEVCVAARRMQNQHPPAPRHTIARMRATPVFSGAGVEEPRAGRADGAVPHGQVGA